MLFYSSLRSFNSTSLTSNLCCKIHASLPITLTFFTIALSPFLTNILSTTVLHPPESYVTFFESSFLNHVLATTSSIAQANSNNISPSAFRIPNPFPPCTSSNPSDLAPTCPFMSPHTTNLSMASIPIKTPPNEVKNSSFSSVVLPTCGAYTDTRFNTDFPTVTLSTMTLSLTLFTSITLSIHLSATKTPTPDIP